MATGAARKRQPEPGAKSLANHGSAITGLSLGWDCRRAGVGVGGGTRKLPQDPPSIWWAEPIRSSRGGPSKRHGTWARRQSV